MKNRHQLPQIPKHKLSDFVKFCQTHGVEADLVQVPLRSLKSSQKEVNKTKIKNMLHDPAKLDSPILISKDNYIVDGHHRWLARAVLNIDGTIPCLQFHADQNNVIELGHEFDGSFTVGVHEILAMYRDVI